MVVLFETVCVSCVYCKCPALTLFYELCADADDITSSLCCNALCDLVYCGHADCTSVLHKLLNTAPVARHVYLLSDYCNS